MKGKDGMSIKVLFYAILVFFLMVYSMLSFKKKKGTKSLLLYRSCHQKLPNHLTFCWHLPFHNINFRLLCWKGEGIRPLNQLTSSLKDSILDLSVITNSSKYMKWEQPEHSTDKTTLFDFLFVICKRPF